MTEPGAGHGGYVWLREIADKGSFATAKVFFQFKEGMIYADGRALQGIKVAEGFAQITGTHYTSWEMATQIRSMHRIEPSLSDPYVYVSEPGKMSGWPEESIQRELGAAGANTEVRLTFVVPIERVWIKASRTVAHYAISGIVAKEIAKLSIQKVS